MTRSQLQISSKNPLIIKIESTSPVAMNESLTRDADRIQRQMLLGTMPDMKTGWTVRFDLRILSYSVVDHRMGNSVKLDAMPKFACGSESCQLRNLYQSDSEEEAQYRYLQQTFRFQISIDDYCFKSDCIVLTVRVWPGELLPLPDSPLGTGRDTLATHPALIVQSQVLSPFATAQTGWVLVGQFCLTVNCSSLMAIKSFELSTYPINE